MNSFYSSLRFFFSFKWVLKYETPQFGQISLWILLALAVHSSRDFIWIHPGHSHGSVVSVLGIIPQNHIENALLIKVSLYLFWTFSLLWASRVWIPYSSLLSISFYLLSGSLYLENRVEHDHTFILLTQVLILYYLWYQFDARRIKRCLKEKTFWRTKLFPQWIYPAVLFLVAYQYFTSAILRLMSSGPSWADGSSLQIWAFLWGDPLSPLTQAIVQDQFKSSILMHITLGLELFAPILLIFRPSRWIAGFILIGFHVANELIFNLGFHYHFFIIILYFYPWQNLARKFK